MKKTKSVILTVLRYLLFSFFAMMLCDCVGLPFRPNERFAVTTGGYFFYTIIANIVFFYTFLFLWAKRWHPEKTAYITSTTEVRKTTDFCFEMTYKETMHTVFRQDLWIYGLFSILPTVSCIISWAQGIPPQSLLSDDFIETVFGFFRIVHIFFDLFIPLKWLCIPIGVLLNLTFFVLAYTLILTLAKHYWWNRASGVLPSKTAGIAKNIAYIIMIIAIILYVILWYGEGAMWFSSPQT